MSTEYESLLLVGGVVSSVLLEDYTYIETMEAEGMEFSDGNIMGFPLPLELKINMASYNQINTLAKKYKKLTGETATIHSCIWSY